ncbi:NADPH-dependent F420 reductase [Nocardioides sp. LML1-1-1.1]|uniref:NADPH-dependent F420 reductase n=1 Tax=Nocardioides sp. LML1-1-1.1 TaxID=3135248 RepID=UPI00342BCA5D
MSTQGTIGIIGGTGPQGRGLATRFAASGLKVLLGSRDAGRAAEAAATIDGAVDGDTNEEVARRADVVLVTVPWEGHGDQLAGLADALAGKVVVDCVNPLGFDKQGPYRLDVAEGSAAQQAAALLPGSTVTAAFHHLSAVVLLDPEVTSIDADVLVLGDDRAATDSVQALAGKISGCRGVYAGRLRNAGQVEALTANLIAMNKRYRAHASVRITDV